MCGQTSVERLNQFQQGILALADADIIRVLDGFLGLKSRMDASPHDRDVGKAFLDFFAVGDRAKYWRHRLGSISLMEIDLPDWAILANKEVHNLEDGMLPVFESTLSS